MIFFRNLIGGKPSLGRLFFPGGPTSWRGIETPSSMERVQLFNPSRSRSCEYDLDGNCQHVEIVSPGKTRTGNSKGKPDTRSDREMANKKADGPEEENTAETSGSLSGKEQAAITGKGKTRKRGKKPNPTPTWGKGPTRSRKEIQERTAKKPSFKKKKRKRRPVLPDRDKN